MKFALFNANLLVTIRLNNYLWRWKKQRKLMEDIFKFLLVIGIIAIGFVRQARKEAKKKTGGSPVMPMPDEESPFPEN